MAQSDLVLHRGAVEVDRQTLAQIAAPPPAGRWYPLPHVRVLEAVCSTLQATGYSVARERLAVGRSGHRFFGVLDLTAPLATGVTLAVGVRNSTDKSFPLGFCAGNRVFCCDNLAFRSELLVTRKHTRHGEARFTDAIAGAVRSLQSFRDAEAERIRQQQHTRLTEAQASHHVLTALATGLVPAPAVVKIWKEVLNPSFDYGTDGLTLWTVLQAFTTVLMGRAKRSPHEYAGLTIRLNALLSPGIDALPFPAQRPPLPPPGTPFLNAA